MRRLLNELLDWGAGIAALLILSLWLLILAGCRPVNANVHSVYVFTSPQCKQCQIDKPLVERVTSPYPVVVVQCDEPAVAAAYNISTLPTYRIVYMDERIFDTHYVSELRARL